MNCKTTARVALIGVVLMTLIAHGAVAESEATVESRADGNTALAERPDEPGSYLNYAAYLSDEGDNPAATVVLERGRVNADASADLMVALARAYQRDKKWSRAETAAREALVIDPRHAEAYVVLGEVYFALDWTRSGLKSYRKAVACDPAATLPQVRYVGGLLDAGDTSEAEDQCLAFISINPDNAELWLALGRIFEKQGKRREAFMTYGQALTIDPESPQAYARQGKLFCEFGQYESAATSCRRALNFSADDALAHAYLGIALSYLGDDDGARKHAKVAEASGMNMTPVWKQLER